MDTTKGDSETAKYRTPPKRNSTPDYQATSARSNYRDGRAHSISSSPAEVVVVRDTKTTTRGLEPRSNSNAQFSNAVASTSGMQNDDSEKPTVSSSMAAELSPTTDGNDELEKALPPRELQKFLAWTLIMCKKIREKPTYSVKVLLYDFITKGRNGIWKEKSEKMVPLHFYPDAARGTFRVLCVDGNRLLLNTSLTTAVLLKKVTAKFAQWLDTKARVAFGIAFQTEIDLELFQSKCKEMQMQIRQFEEAQNETPPPCGGDWSTEDTMDMSLSVPPSPQPSPQPSPRPSPRPPVKTPVKKTPMSERRAMMADLERLKSAVAERQEKRAQSAKLWDLQLERLRRHHAATQSMLRAMLSLHEDGKGLRNRSADINTGAGASHGRPQSHGTSLSTKSRTFSATLPQVHRRSLSESYGNSANMFQSEQLQTILHNMMEDTHRRLHGNEAAVSENRRMILQIHKAMMEKMNEMMAYHRLLDRLLQD